MNIDRLNRKSNLELLRILCILFIVSYHFVYQSGIFYTRTFKEVLFYYSISGLGRNACSVFVIIGAWFLVDREFKFSQVFNLYFTFIFYTFVKQIYLYAQGITNIQNFDSLFVITRQSVLWFATNYILLLLMTPLLNLILNKIERKKIEAGLLIFGIISCLLPTLTTIKGTFQYEIWTLVFLYLLTGYIKKYKSDLTSISKKKSFIIFTSVYLTLILALSISKYYENANPIIMKRIFEYAYFYLDRLYTIPNIILAYSIFFFFYQLDIKNNKIINTLASTSFGVYCFHQNPDFYYHLWKDIFKSDYYSSALIGNKRAFYTIIVIFIVFIVGVILELLRKYLSYHLIESKRFYKNICNRIDAIVNGESDIREKDNPIFIKKSILLISIWVLLITFISRDMLFTTYVNMTNYNINERYNLTLDANLDNKSQNVSGIIKINNNDNKRVTIKRRYYPINIGISIVDENKKIIENDYLHITIDKNVIKANSSIEQKIDISIDNKYFKKGYGIKIELVQEQLGWIHKTINYYFFK